MAGVSEESTALVAKWAEPTLASAKITLARELFSLLSVLDSSAGLRRALTDPSRDEQQKASLVSTLVGGKVSTEASSILQKLAGSRFSDPRDIADALESLAATAAICVAANTGAGAGLEKLENELFAFTSTLASSHDLQRALSEPQASEESKLKLARSVSPNVSEPARLLIDQAVANPRGEQPAKLVERLAALAAGRQQRWIAEVSVTRPLTEEQQYRLQSGLNRLYGRELKLNISRDPELLGGIRVKVGDEVLDASVMSRLSTLRRKLTGEVAS